MIWNILGLAYVVGIVLAYAALDRMIAKAPDEMWKVSRSTAEIRIGILAYIWPVTIVLALYYNRRGIEDED